MAVPKIWRQIPELYNLQGSLCEDCKDLQFPKREVCPACHSVKLIPYPFEGKGKIETFTIIHTPSTDPEAEQTDIPARNSPYCMAIVKLEEGPRLTTQIVGHAMEQITIGQRVRMVFRKIMEKGHQGVIQYGYKFT